MIKKSVKVWHPANIYGGNISIDDDCMIGAFTEIQPDVKIGKRTRVQSHTFICSKTTIGDDCFIGHGVMFINDRNPPSGGKWEPINIGNNVVIGSNSTILPVTICDGTVIGAGSVVTKDILKKTVVKGNPAHE